MREGAGCRSRRPDPRAKAGATAQTLTGALSDPAGSGKGFPGLRPGISSNDIPEISACRPHQRDGQKYSIEGDAIHKSLFFSRRWRYTKAWMRSRATKTRVQTQLYRAAEAWHCRDRNLLPVSLCFLPWCVKEHSIADKGKSMSRAIRFSCRDLLTQCGAPAQR